MRPAVAAVTLASGGIDPGSSVNRPAAMRSPSANPLQRILVVLFRRPGSLKPGDTMRPSVSPGGRAGEPELAAVRDVKVFGRCLSANGGLLAVAGRAAVGAHAGRPAAHHPAA